MKTKREEKKEGMVSKKVEAGQEEQGKESKARRIGQ
jgi:hypothetical protein